MRGIERFPFFCLQGILFLPLILFRQHSMCVWVRSDFYFNAWSGMRKSGKDGQTPHICIIEGLLCDIVYQSQRFSILAMALVIPVMKRLYNIVEGRIGVFVEWPSTVHTKNEWRCRAGILPIFYSFILPVWVEDNYWDYIDGCIQGSERPKCMMFRFYWYLLQYNGII